jgi:hypothetical protein
MIQLSGFGDEWVENRSCVCTLLKNASVIFSLSFFGWFFKSFNEMRLAADRRGGLSFLSGLDGITPICARQIMCHI